MGRPFFGNDVPRKESITGASLGFRPQPVRARVQGEDEGQYRKYVKGMQGDQARRIATQQGLDTSGMAWDGTQFKDANWEHWWEDPGVVGPIAVMATGGYQMGANGALGSTVQGLLGGGGSGVAGTMPAIGNVNATLDALSAARGLWGIPGLTAKDLILQSGDWLDRLRRRNKGR